MNKKPIQVEGGLRTQEEIQEIERVKTCFERNPETWEKKMENFPKYVRRSSLTRFLALYEIFKLVQKVKGSIVECGVFRGFGIMSWAKLSAILEPVNLTRRIYGFDSFSGFPRVSEMDKTEFSSHVSAGDLYADSHDEIVELANINDSTRFLGHISKVILVKGDATETIPQFLQDNSHLIVSLLYLDFDLYDPTLCALENFLPRMPRGAVIAFDELDNPLWPGETLALIEKFRNRMPKIQRFDFDPYIGYIVLD